MRSFTARNCPVFAAAARTFFDRPAPQGYLADWTRWQPSRTAWPVRERARAVEKTTMTTQLAQREGVSVPIFRLGGEWLAFRTRAVAGGRYPGRCTGCPTARTASSPGW
jgi:chemotaxis-related protein WspD